MRSPGIMKNLHILLAEDEIHLRYTLSLILRRSGYLVTTVTDGEAALREIQQKNPSSIPVDLLVTDIQMPVLTGLELLEELEEQNINIPTIVITGYGTRDMWFQLFKMGLVNYLEKPFNPRELLELIEDIVEHNTEEKNTPHAFTTED